MTKPEVLSLMKQLRIAFDIVRLVDAAITSQCNIDDDGTITREDYRCYAVWNKTGRCENCISAKAYASKGKLCKFEFVDHEVYYVVAMYIEVEGEPFVLEMVSHVTDQTLFGAYGKSEFIKSISNYNWRLYRDALTGVYNRQYYDEQLHGLPRADAVAMLDIDHFKQINDGFGHPAGDDALRAIAHTLQANMRSTDAVVRFGGDEFLLVFRNMPEDAFRKRLEKIRAEVEQLQLPEHPEVKLSVSIGGLYAPRDHDHALEEADRLLYVAKKQRNSVAFPDED